MAPLQKRRRRPEIMDQPGLDPARHARALAGLSRINRLSLTERTYWRPLRELQTRLSLPRLRILDVACGGGDVARRLARLAMGADLDWRIGGCDLSPVAVEHARAASFAEETPVHYFAHDLLSGPPPGEWDAVVCSLFLHHLDEGPAVEMLRAIARPTEADGPRLVLINDLDRRLFGLILAHVVTRLVTRCDVVHVDGPRSVEAAFAPDEALELAHKAGLSGATIRRVWPWRWLLSWSRP
jgi:2-polyprenyl-3-methyl-5-hydroxy-6-metoxy-1,4-benzoquinol methylase